MLSAQTNQTTCCNRGTEKHLTRLRFLQYRPVLADVHYAHKSQMRHVPTLGMRMQAPQTNTH